MCIRYKFSFIVTFVILSITSCILFKYFHAVPLNSLYVDDSVYQMIINKRELSDTSLVQEISFNNQRLHFDLQKGIWLYSLVDSEKNKFNPNVKFIGKTNSVKLVFKKHILDSTFVKGNQTLDFLAYNDKSYSTFSLKITTLPIIDIRIIPATSPLRENESKMKFILFDNSQFSTRREITSEGLIHVRGAVSRLLQKNSFRISLTKSSVGGNTRKNKLSLLKMRQDEDWILYSPYGDHEKVRQVFSMNLWHEACGRNNEFGIDNSTEYKFVELFFNNSYYGLYALGFPIDAKQQRIKKNLDGSFAEFIFYKYWWDPSEVETIGSNKQTLQGYELRTKNFLKYRLKPVLTEDMATYEEAMYINNKKAWSVLREYYTNLINAHNVKTLYEIADINNAIDIYLFLNFIQASDHIDFFEVLPHSIKHIYFTFKQKGSDYKALYEPWDCEAVMGDSIRTMDFIPTNWIIPNFITPDKNYIMYFNPVVQLQQLRDRKINKLVKKRYSQLRKTFWSEKHLNKLIDEYEKDIFDSGAFSREKTIWPSGTYPEKNVKLQNFRNHVMKRLQYMDKFVHNLK